MTGDIRTILDLSHAAESLRMEMRITKIFEKHNWTTERGMYYADIDTGKIREIDVFAKKIFERPQVCKVSGPLISMDVFCECKSLVGSNVLLSPGKLPRFHRDEMMRYWVGVEEDLQKIVLNIAEQANVKNRGAIKALFDYVMSRAYPRNDAAVISPVSMRCPPVDLIARGFRETKNGKDDRDLESEKARINPIWAAIQSSRSAMSAAITKSRNFAFDSIHGYELMFYGIDNFIDWASNYLDTELLRLSYFHPMIVVKSKLWKLDENEISEVMSARIVISSIGYDHFYVDIVNYSYIERYIELMISQFSKESRRSVSEVWKQLQNSEWMPGQAEGSLRAALGLKS